MQRKQGRDDESAPVTYGERGLSRRSAAKSLSLRVRPMASMMKPSVAVYDPGATSANLRNASGRATAAEAPAVT
jgi:hypothetical protein